MPWVLQCQVTSKWTRNEKSRLAQLWAFAVSALPLKNFCNIRTERTHPCAPVLVCFSCGSILNERKWIILLTGMEFQSIFFLYPREKRCSLHSHYVADACVRIVRILSPLIISGLAFGLRLNDPIFVRQNIHPGHLFFREKAYKTDRRKNTFLIAGRYIVVGRLDCVSTGIRTFTSSSALLSLPNTKHRWYFDVYYNN